MNLIAKLPVVMAVIILGIACCLGYNYIYVPNQERVTAIQAKITLEKATQQSQSEVATLLEELDKYRKRLPPAPDASWLAKQVVQISEQANIQLKSISQENPQINRPFFKLAVNVEFNSGYHELGAFLDLIERAGSYLQVERLDVEKVGSQGRAAPLTFIHALAIVRA